MLTDCLVSVVQSILLQRCQQKEEAEPDIRSETRHTEKHTVVAFTSH